MAEVSRSDTPLKDPEYPGGASNSLGGTDPAWPAAKTQQFDRWGGASVSTTPGNLPLDHLLPERATDSNRGLNRSARRVGRGVGTAVANVRHLPRQIRGMKSRLYVVGEHARGNAAERAATLKDSAADRLSQLGNNASARASELADRLNHRLDEARRIAARKTTQARQTARRRVIEARVKVQYWKSEYPLQTIAALAGVAFVTGMALRIWRSNSELDND